MIIRTAALALAVLLHGAALAADPTFPPGSRVGLEPPKEMVVSKRFVGFERPAGGATITVVELQPEAAAELRAMPPEAFLKQGFEVKGREDVKLASGADAVLFSGSQSSTAGPSVRRWLLVAGDPTMTALVVAQALPDGTSDESIRAALLTVTTRPPLSLEEKVAALPFRLTDRAGFRPVRVLGGNALLLTDGPDDTFPSVTNPIVIVAEASQARPPAEQRDAFARAALFGNASLKEVVVERSESFRQRGSDWHEIVARATDAASGTPVVVSQTLRFGPDTIVRVLGITKAEARTENLSRFRAVADGVALD